MNPNDFLLHNAASSSSSSLFQPPPLASTSNGTAVPSTLLNGTVTTAALLPPAAMDLDLPPPVDEQKPKTKKELEQEKKDLELAELLEMMDEWRPIIPDEVTDYYLQRSGFETSDIRVKRLLALAAQRFVSSISADAFQYARTRTAAGPGGRSTKEGAAARAKERTRTVLTMEDLSAALKEYGVGADRAQYYL